MYIKRSNLIKLIDQFLNEQSETPSSQQSVSPTLNMLMRIKEQALNRGITKNDIADLAYKSDLIEGEGIMIVRNLEEYLREDSPATEDKKRLKVGKQVIRYGCHLFDISDDAKIKFLQAYDKVIRHIFNPALPFVTVMASFGSFFGFSFYLFLVFQYLWMTNRDGEGLSYYKLERADSEAMKYFLNVLTIGASADFSDNLRSRCIENKDAFILYSLQSYCKDNMKKRDNFEEKFIEIKNYLEKNNSDLLSMTKSISSRLESDNPYAFEHEGISFNFDGSESSKNKAKKALKSMIFAQLTAAAKDAVVKAGKSYLAQDPEALHRKERESIRKSAGTTAAKFNVLDNL